MIKITFFRKGFRGPPFVPWRMEESEPLDNQRVLCYIHGEPDAGKDSSLSSPSHRLKSQGASIEPAWD